MMREGVALTWTGGPRKHQKEGRASRRKWQAAPGLISYNTLGGLPASYWHPPGALEGLREQHGAAGVLPASMPASDELTMPKTTS